MVHCAVLYGTLCCIVWCTVLYCMVPCAVLCGATVWCTVLRWSWVAILIAVQHLLDDCGSLMSFVGTPLYAAPEVFTTCHQPPWLSVCIVHTRDCACSLKYPEQVHGPTETVKRQMRESGIKPQAYGPPVSPLSWHAAVVCCVAHPVRRWTCGVPAAWCSKCWLASPHSTTLRHWSVALQCQDWVVRLILVKWLHSIYN